MRTLVATTHTIQNWKRSSNEYKLWQMLDLDLCMFKPTETWKIELIMRKKMQKISIRRVGPKRPELAINPVNVHASQSVSVFPFQNG